MMLLSLFIFACTEQPESPEVIEQDILAEFKAQLSGRFTSEAQSLTDTSYYSVQLHACSVDVPELGADVLYIEQALVNNIQSPYRQRFYVLSDLGDDWVRSEIYTLSDEDSFVGLCNEDEISSFPASVATHKEGCHVVLEWDGDVFFGQTKSDSCPSTMGGASYATSIVQTTSSQISSWDQGWDDQENQVWGAIEGAYLFDRKE